MLGIIFVYLQKILEQINIFNMRLNFNTIIYPIYGFCVGVNYWDSAMDHVVLESEVVNQTEHCLELHFGIFAISFVWYSN
jgi:hypothetical protein